MWRCSRTVTANMQQWDECQECPDFDGCYKLSMAKLALETAIQNQYEHISRRLHKPGRRCVAIILDPTRERGRIRQSPLARSAGATARSTRLRRQLLLSSLPRRSKRNRTWTRKRRMKWTMIERSGMSDGFARWNLNWTFIEDSHRALASVPILSHIAIPCDTPRHAIPPRHPAGRPCNGVLRLRSGRC